MMKTTNLLFSFLAALMLAGTSAIADDLIDGYTRILYADDLQDGKAYFIISDRTKFAGNTTGKPKGMSLQLDSYKIKWGDQYVYWGDFDAQEDGFVWIAEKVGDDQWAFKNKVKGQYLGRKSGSDNDVTFSSTPVAYTLTDLEDGEGRFYMISDEDSRSPHVQGFVRGDRPNNCLAKQDVGITTYVDDVATNGYPARWHIYALEGGSDPGTQPEFYSAADGYYNIVSANPALPQKMCWTEMMADAPAFDSGASLTFGTLHSGDPRSIYRIEAIDKNNGQYKIYNYVTDKYVSGTQDGCVVMSDEDEETLTFRTVRGERNTLYICNADGDTLFAANADGGIAHVRTAAATDKAMAAWKLQKVDAAQLQSPSAKLRLALAVKLDEVGHPDFTDYSYLGEEKLLAFRNLWDKASRDLALGAFDIIYEQYIANLDAAAEGQYDEPVYNKYQKRPLRVMSYNVKHCAGNHDGLNLARTASVIAAQQADVVALQEVDSVFGSRSDYKYQVKELAQATGMYGIFCSALTGYGIGILSKELPLSVRVVSLTSDFEPRRMLVAEFRDYVFASLHVGLSANARRGTGPIIKAEAERWVETGKPLIIAGDFNDDGTDSEMEGARGVLTKYLQQNGFTYHTSLTTPTWSDGIYVIDHIISYDPIGGVKKVSTEVINDKVTSDHMPIVGDFIIGFDDATGINSLSPAPAPGSGEETLNAEWANGKCYDLSGRMVTGNRLDGKSSRGIYIIGGEKILK